MVGAQQDRPNAGTARPRVVLDVGLVLLALIGVGAHSWFALICVALDGLFALTVIAPFALGGLRLVPLLRIKAVPLRWHLLIGAALGIGTAFAHDRHFSQAGFESTGAG